MTDADLAPECSASSIERVAAARSGQYAQSFGSFLSDRPEPNSRTRDANVAGISTTVSPAARSC
jgi:hypothetical protein